MGSDLSSSFAAWDAALPPSYRLLPYWTLPSVVFHLGDGDLKKNSKSAAAPSYPCCPHARPNCTCAEDVTRSLEQNLSPHTGCPNRPKRPQKGRFLSIRLGPNTPSWRPTIKDVQPVTMPQWTHRALGPSPWLDASGGAAVPVRLPWVEGRLPVPSFLPCCGRGPLCNAALQWRVYLCVWAGCVLLPPGLFQAMHSPD